MRKKIEKKIARKLQKTCKKIAKKLQNVKKTFFLMCKIFQILNLHTDFRPREESVRSLIKIFLLELRGPQKASYVVKPKIIHLRT